MAWQTSSKASGKSIVGARITITAILIALAIALVGGGITAWLQWEWLLSFWKWLGSREEDRAYNGDALRNLGFIIAGLAALGFAIWRGVVAQKQANAAKRQTETGQQSLLNERYQRGAEMLGSPVLSVRFGGIYALQRLAEEHPEQYHVQVMRLFCAFVRNPPSMRRKRATKGELRLDVQDVITAIGKRSYAGLRLEAEADFSLDLRGARLECAHMMGLNFAGSDLEGADLSGARFLRANLSDARLGDVNLSDSYLTEANLSGAYLDGADLSGARLFETNLCGATLVSTELSGANFEGATVSGILLPTQPRFTATGQIILSGGYTSISQRQLDQTVADPDNPPWIPDGAIDPETDGPLVWRGGSANPQS